MFRGFRDRIDGLADQRERLIKISRDITSSSKKAIFTLHRMGSLARASAPLHASVRGGDADAPVYAEAKQRFQEIFALFEQAHPDLRGADLHRFGRQITGGLQEYIEAVTFMHYLQTGHILSQEELNASLCKDGEQIIAASAEDYVLGLADLSGELMRYAINAIGLGNRDAAFAVLETLRRLLAAFNRLNQFQVYGLKAKVAVMESSLEKVEKACYAIVVRGSEYPKEMLASFLQQQSMTAGGPAGGDGDAGGGDGD